jgi:hypothetical protein
MGNVGMFYAHLEYWPFAVYFMVILWQFRIFFTVLVYVLCQEKSGSPGLLSNRQWSSGPWTNRQSNTTSAGRKNQ